MLLYCRWKKSRYCSSVNSCDPPPDPMITPKRRFWARGREAASMPATPNASVAAAIASGSTRETCLRSRRSTHASSSKSATSPAICTEISDASKREMHRTPLRPSSTACEKDGLPTPLGLTAPMPVITTRRCTRTSISLEYTSIARRALYNCLQNVILQNQQRCSEPLASRPTSINKDRLSCYERSCGRSQKYHRSGDVHRFTNTVQRRDSLQYISAVLRHGKILFGSRRANERRRHGINRDSVLSPFDCQTLRQMGDGRFGHAVHRFTWQRGKSCLRTHIDNSPMLLANHHSPRRLAGKKRSLQIHCQGRIKVLLADVFRQILGSNPGVVHQDVEPSEPGRSFIHRAENLLHVGISICNGSACLAMPSISRTSSPPDAASRNPSATSAPACARASEIARPSPRAAPVTSATCPCKSNRGKSFMRGDYIIRASEN